MGGGKGSRADPSWHVSIYQNFESLKLKKKKKKSSNYSDCEMWICYRVECCVWERFLFKASGSCLACVVAQVKSLCLLVNNLDTPSYHLSLNDSDEMGRVKSEVIRDKENNRGRLWQKKNKQDDATFRPPSFFLVSTTRTVGWLW